MEHKLLFKAMVGSQAQGTATPQSDIDIKGVYIQKIEDLITFDYEEYVEVSKDESYYEIRRFVELLLSANPNAIEILFSPDDCVLETTPEFKILQEYKNIFLTKKCYGTFAGYANMQIKKATGLDKKMNWETQRVERKSPLDFCYMTLNGKTSPITSYLEKNGLEQNFCGLVKLSHFDNTYAMYYDHGGNENFKGIVGENSNELRLSSISKEFEEAYRISCRQPIILCYNKDGYTTHCKDFKSYNTWLAERNTNRYHTNKSHGQIYDSKNLSHCRRLIDVAIEIAQTGTFTVRRPNVDYLLEIKRGDVPLDQIISDAERDIAGLKEMYDASSLPDDVDRSIVKDILLRIRQYEHAYREPKKIAVLCETNEEFLEWKNKQGHNSVPTTRDTNSINNRKQYTFDGNTYFFVSLSVNSFCGLSSLDDIIEVGDVKNNENYEKIYSISRACLKR